MSYLKSLNSLKILSKNIRHILFIPSKSLCSKKVDVNIKIKVEKDNNQQKNSDPVEVTQKHNGVIHVVTKRDRDTTLNCGISKEYNKLVNGKKVLKIVDGFNLSIDEATLKKPTGDKSLDKTITNLKDKILSDVLPPEKPPTKKLALVRSEPGPVILCFIPREWFTAFIPITGVTGFGTFLFTVGTFLVSKEFYVLEHNFYGGISTFILMAATIRYVGPQLAAYIDKEIQAYEDNWNNMKQLEVDNLNTQIQRELRVQFQADGNLMLVPAKRENVALQLEDEFRQRQLVVYEEVKKLLDYNVAVGNIQRRIQQKNLVNYVFNAVLCACTPEMQNKLIDVSIENLLDELNKVKASEPPTPLEPCEIGEKIK